LETLALLWSNSSASLPSNSSIEQSGNAEVDAMALIKAFSQAIGARTANS
jgi:hypothetical protein